MSKVLLTGVTGFLGSHITIQLLNKGYEVVGTMRDLKRSLEMLEVLGKYASTEKLTFVQADLTHDNDWNDLMKGVEFVQHIASPFPRTLPKTDREIVETAVQGTLNVLRAAAANSIKRVVLTSSTGAIVYGKTKGLESKTYNEEDWTDAKNYSDTTPYFRSKTLAERVAWEFVESDKSGLELTTICPGAILGPVIEKDFGTSANIVIKTIDGSTPAIPQIGFDMVDVRSVAELHVLAMEKSEAANERFVGSAGFMTFKDVADTLRFKYRDRKIPKALLPNFMVKAISNFDSTLKPILIDLGKKRKVDNSKAKTLLGWKPLSNKEAVISCAESVIQMGIV